MRQYVLCFCIILSLIHCTDNENKKEQSNQSADIASIKGGFTAERNQFFDSSLVPFFLEKYPAFSQIRTELKFFYQQRNYALAWFDTNGMIEQAGNLYNHIRNIEDEGINADKLRYQKELNLLMEAVGDQMTDSSRAATDLMLTAQYLQYAKTVWQGIDEKETLSLEWLLPRKSVSYVALLDSLVSGKDVLTNPPVYAQYYQLREFLKKYRSMESADTVQVGDMVTRLDKGDSSLDLFPLKRKLSILGDLNAKNVNKFYDDSLVTALQRFQSRMGLKITGKIAPSDLAEINIPLHKRIETIIVNMERSRWVTQKPAPDHILVNIPEFKLYVVENGIPQWSMNVVVGKNQHKTVVFNGDIKYIVFSPYWNIPNSIVQHEILPGIRRNANYLRRHNMEWNNGGIRQKPGKNNSLGLVKFLFPNSHSIYLHDTPSKSLFNETNRAFSHGCIRLAEPQKLATYLLRSDTSWTENKIKKAMNAGVEKTVTLKKPEPVFIAYFTAWVAQDGQLNLRKDIYQRDTNLLEMILK